MAQVIVRTKVLGWADGGLPGSLELSLVDAGGAEHRIVEKAPVLSSVEIPAAGPFPRELWIRGVAAAPSEGRVAVTFAHGVATTADLDRLELAVTDLAWL